jgi:hypothetical protein
MYEQTHNPLHAWAALQMCAVRMRGGRYRSETLPPWLLDYVIACARSLWMIADYNGGTDADVPKDIAEAFGFKPRGRGVRRQAFLDYVRDGRDFMLASQVRRGRQEQPTHSLEAIVAAVAEAERVSPESIWRAWSAWSAFLEEEYGPVQR